LKKVRSEAGLNNKEKKTQAVENPYKDRIDDLLELDDNSEGNGNLE
jgi:hypothetical protein